MKLKVIAANFKRNKRLVIWNRPNGEQWITNGHAAYLIDGMPTLTTEAMLKIFDIPESKQGEWHCDIRDMPQSIIALLEDDITRATSKVEAKPFLTSIIDANGTTNLLFGGGRGILVVNEQYVKPLYDNSDYLVYFKSTLFETNGEHIVKSPYLLCRVGFDFKAIIMPIMLGDTTINEINEISTYFINHKDEYKTQYASANIIDGIDPETGEVLDEESEEPYVQLLGDETDESQETFADDTYASESEEQPEKKTSRKRAGK